MLPKELMLEWGDCVILHNRPFYSTTVIEDKKPEPPKEVRVKKSFYELSKSWHPLDLTGA
jgi:hypothetical protein